MYLILTVIEIYGKVLSRLLQRLKSALWLSIGKIVDEETIKLGVNATPQFIGALTEMVWAQIGMNVHPFSNIMPITWTIGLSSHIV